MDFSQIFNVYSRRRNGSNKVIKPLTLGFRNRILFLCTETFSEFTGLSSPPSMSYFWTDIHKKLRFLHARPVLTDMQPISIEDDAIEFILQCSDEHFLDFVEMIFKSKQPWVHNSGINLRKLVEDVNTFLEVDNLPYFLTGFVFPSRPPGSNSRTIYTSLPENPPVDVYPKIICREDEVLHQQAIEPTLTLLAEPHFASANEEFLEAHRHYRKGEYRDCVLKCGNSFESVMKIICDRKGWPYSPADTAGPLLKGIIRQTDLESFYEQPLILIATIRNKLSSAHGAGPQQKIVSKHVANYVINATASAILLLVDETNP